jgi:hypothetical protein
VETKDNAIEKGKGILQITQGESEVEGPTLTIEHLSSSMLLLGGIKKTTTMEKQQRKIPPCFLLPRYQKEKERDEKGDVPPSSWRENQNRVANNSGLPTRHLQFSLVRF